MRPLRIAQPMQHQCASLQAAPLVQSRQVLILHLWCVSAMMRAISIMARTRSWFFHIINAITIHTTCNSRGVTRQMQGQETHTSTPRGRPTLHGVSRADPLRPPVRCRQRYSERLCLAAEALGGHSLGLRRNGPFVEKMLWCMDLVSSARMCVGVKFEKLVVLSHIFGRRSFFMKESPKLKMLMIVLGLPSPHNIS